MFTLGRRLLVLPLVVLFFAVGCGGSKSAPGKVSGTVKYKGAAVTGGQINFYLDKVAYPGGIDPDGSYKMSQLPAGDYKVTVETESINPDKKTPEYGAGKGGAKGGGMSPPPPGRTDNKGKYVKIPEKYNDPTKTDLSAKITGGNNTVNLELKD